jgi:4-amino-4-deoxy-L-arabinose transferase-like glycosyltransferase
VALSRGISLAASRRLRVPRSLVAILLVYLVLAAGYTLATPRWNNPDEPAHYNYLAHLARSGHFPVLQPGDWDSRRLNERLASGRFSTDQPIEEFRYEGHQPPLYYLLMAPLYRLVEGLGSNVRVVALRFASIGLGLLLIVVVYAAGRALAPQRAELAPLAAGLVALIPMHTAMTAAINNDTLAELMASATLLAIVVGLRRGFCIRDAVAIGTLCGGLLLTKLTVYIFVPLALLAVAIGTAVPIHSSLGQGKLQEYQWRRAIRYVALAVLIAAVLSAWWFVRNLLIYGWPDSFGLIRHDQVVVGQARWPGLGDNLESIRFLLYSTFRSFWAQFGWMAVVMDPRQERPYWLFLLFTLLALGGFRCFWRTELPTWPPAAALALRFLVAVLVVVMAQLLAYNLTFIQAQGRYLYPAILPIGLLLALGWSTVAEVAPGASRWRWFGFGIGFYWLWAAGVEAISWLVAAASAPPILHVLTIAPTWLATKVQIRRPRESLAGIAATALLVVLGLVNAAALLRFVVPYFR